jgi:hypothetical protein
LDKVLSEKQNLTTTKKIVRKLFGRDRDSLNGHQNSQFFFTAEPDLEGSEATAVVSCTIVDPMLTAGDLAGAGCTLKTAERGPFWLPAASSVACS